MPDISSIRTPHEILLEQGQYLAEMTGGLLDCLIERRQKNTLFSYEFYISVPVIDYKQALLRITHDIKLFPAILANEQSGEEYTANNQDEFENDLEAILSSEDTRTIISGLLAQARLESELHK
ncbi:MAG: hypothetical protein GXP51_02055 [Deltaproteobacteria bacterium]|nr:hypothetical protein [Deltaproteobacteria bacterium]